MKRWIAVFMMIGLLIMTLLAFAPAAQAAPAGSGSAQLALVSPAAEAPPGAFDLNDLVMLVIGFGSMAGVAALVSIVVDIFKRFGLVQDGQAPRWSAALNLLLLIGLVAARYFAPQLSVEFLDAQAGLVAQLATIILSFVMQLTLSAKFHDAAQSQSLPTAYSNSQPQ